MRFRDPSFHRPAPRLRRLSAAPLIALLALLFLAGIWASCSRTAAPRPNLLVVVVDCMRPDFLGFNGYPVDITPTLDRLAASGVVFDQARSPATWTKPAIASLFSGLSPWRHGILHIDAGTDGRPQAEILPKRIETLAERLRGAGYSTVAAVYQPHLTWQDGFGQGFDIYRHVDRVNAPGMNVLLIKALDQMDASKPYFAYLHLLDVHAPYTRSLPQSQISGHSGLSDSVPECVHRLEMDPECLAAEVAWLQSRPGKIDLRRLRRRYAREIEYVDSALSGLLDALRKHRRLKNTVVVVTADHGEAFGEHDQLFHGFAPFSELLRVPLIFWSPENRGWTIGNNDTPVLLTDLYPTLLSLAGVPVPNGLDGRDLVPMLDGNVDRRRIVVSQAAEADAATDGRWKLITYHGGRELFYDLRRDAEENAPLEGPCEGRCAELREALLAQRPASDEPGGERRSLDSKTVEQLQSLGYL